MMTTPVVGRLSLILGVIVVLIAANAILGPAYALETTTPGGETAWNWKEVITLAIAVFGAGLGLLNTWSAINARRLHVMVRTTFAYPLGEDDAPFMMGIEVINLSAFAITITEVGFTLQGTTKRAASSRPQVLDDKPWPRRLEARDAVSTYVHPPMDSEFPVRAAYARLASGEVVTGRGKAIKNLRAAQSRECV